MSILYCYKHDIRWDSDKYEMCPRCLDEIDLEIQKGNVIEDSEFNVSWNQKIKDMAGDKK